MMNCKHCDVPGGEKTCEYQVCMPINGRVRAIDFCIHPIVAALNAAGIETFTSCCGHEQLKGMIGLKDGRTLIVQKTPKDMKEWRKAVRINGVKPSWRRETK